MAIEQNRAIGLFSCRKCGSTARPRQPGGAVICPQHGVLERDQVLRDGAPMRASGPALTTRAPGPAVRVITEAQEEQARARARATLGGGTPLVVEEWRTSDDPDVVAIEHWRRPSAFVEAAVDDLYAPLINAVVEKYGL